MKTSFANEPAYRIPTKATDDTNTSTDNLTKPNFVIPLETPKETDDPDRKYLSVKRTLPVSNDDQDGPKYEIYVRRYDQGTPRQWLKFLDNWEEVKVQLNLTNGPSLYNNFKTLLSGDALQKWNSIIIGVNKTVETFTTKVI